MFGLIYNIFGNRKTEGEKAMADKFVTKGDILGMLKGKNIKDLTNRPDSGRRIAIESFEDLMKRDEQREKDGFPKKIKIRKILAGRDNIIPVPYAEEEKLIHGNFEPASGQGKGTGGQGEGEEGEVIGERPIEGEGEEGDSSQAGKEEGEHGLESNAYELGKKLSEEFELPNLKDKGKKVPTTEYIYDLTDRHRGSGQVLDKKETLRSIVRTNSSLGRINKDDIDTKKMIVGPNDKIYRVLSREKIWKSQAIVFLARDYSGSMGGDPTEIIVAQHLMIYSWLFFQYEKLVIPRFIVHDMKAKEVSVEEYFKLNASGGTRIASAFEKVNEIVESEGLEKDYNIYVFYGGDGDDSRWQGDDKKAISEIERILTYANRMGACVKHNGWAGDDNETVFEENIKNSNVYSNELFRMYVMSSQDNTEEKNIEAIKHLIS